MRRLMLLAAATVVAAIVGAPGGAGATASCRVLDYAYDAQGRLVDGRYVMRGQAETTLDCPAGHPLDGRGMQIEQDTVLSLGSGDSGGPTFAKIFDETHDFELNARAIRGRTQITMVGYGDSGDGVRGFRGRVQVLEVEVNAEHVRLLLEIDAQSAEGARLALTEVALIDRETRLLESLEVVSGFARPSVNDDVA